MKKKTVMLITIGIAMCLASACQKAEEKEVIEFHDVVPEEVPVVLRDENYVPATQESEVADEEETTTEPEDIVPFCNRREVFYEVQIQNVRIQNASQGDFKIEYPQISGMEDTELMERINTSIQEYLMPQEVLEDEACVTYELHCEIATKGTGVLSFVCRGYEMYEGAAHPTQFVKTMNLDMTDGSNIRLKEYADIATIVSNLELGQGYTIVNSEVEKEDFSAFLNNGYVTDYAITLLDYDIDLQQPEHFQEGYSYIKENHPVICVPVEHVLGDYIEVCFAMQIS